MRYAFAGCELDTDRRELHVNGNQVPLEPRVFDVLAYLVARGDRVVSKEELLDELWGDRFVSEATLAGNIRAARAAVGDDGKSQSILRTVHGSGYRFVAALDEPPPRQAARPPGTPGNLPLPAGRLIGREADIVDVTALLSTNRLVTLVGTGGVGKTRAAIEVGRRLEGVDPDGVWLAMLETVEDGGGVARSLLGLLGVDEQPGRQPHESLAAGLRSRRCLLVLDNCEHVLDAVATIAAALLRSCPGVRMLATSREPIDIDGEHVRRILPLEVDGGRGPAAELFFERAAQAGCALDPLADGPDVTRICEHVDGLPLAIELAAARARSLTPPEIADRLRAGIAVLAGGRRTAPARQRTLLATLEWSYELLGSEEQQLLNRLSVFRGSCDLPAIEGLCTDASLVPSAAVDVVDQLTLRSLVVAEAVGGRSRYRLLESVRPFAWERLVDAGEAEPLRDAHAGWYLDLLVQADHGWRAGDDQQWWPVAQAEMANLRAAFDRLVATGRVDEAQQLAVSAYGPIVMHFDLEPEFEWAARASDMAPDHIGPWTARCRAMAAWGAAKRADLDRAATWAQGALDALGAGSPDDGLVTLSVSVLPVFGGRCVAPASFFRQARADALASGDLNRIVWVLTFTNRAVEAVPYARRQGNLVNLAIAMRAACLFDRAGRGRTERSDLEEILRIAEQSNSSTTRNNALFDLALFDLSKGNLRRAGAGSATLARDWQRRGDARAWTALAATAVALDGLGERGGAAALARLVASRPILRHPLLEDLEQRVHVLAAGEPPCPTEMPNPNGHEGEAHLAGAVELALASLEGAGVALDT